MAHIQEFTESSIKLGCLEMDKLLMANQKKKVHNTNTDQFFKEYVLQLKFLPLVAFFQC